MIPLPCDCTHELISGNVPTISSLVRARNLSGPQCAVDLCVIFGEKFHQLVCGSNAATMSSPMVIPSPNA